MKLITISIIWTIVAGALYLVLKIIENKKLKKQGKNKPVKVSSIEELLKEYEDNDRGTNSNFLFNSYTMQIYL